jgi:hypothetical protein
VAVLVTVAPLIHNLVSASVMDITDPRRDLDRIMIELNEFIRELVRIKVDMDSIYVAKRLLDIRDGVNSGIKPPH